MRFKVGLRLVKDRVRVSETRRALSQSRAEGGGSEGEEVDFWHRHFWIGKNVDLSSGFCCPSLRNLTHCINFTIAIV